VGLAAPDCTDLMEGEVGMEGDDADARKEGRGRVAALDVEEGDECGDMTFVVGRVLVAVMGPMGGEWRVEEGDGEMGRLEKREGKEMTWATLDIADTSHL
jgi:hypothetical protein